MAITPIPGDRPWLRHYPDTVRRDFAPDPTTMTALMTRAFDRYADTVHIEYYGTSYTYADMRAQVARVASALRARGIGKGDCVALHLPNCPWHPIFFFGVLAAGAAVTHLSPLDAHHELSHKLRDSGAKLAVTLTTPELGSHIAPLLASGETPPLVMCPDQVSAMGRVCPVLEGAMSVADFLSGHDGAAYDPVPVTPGDTALLNIPGAPPACPRRRC